MPLLTVFVLTLFFASLLSRPIERLRLTAPIIFTLVGLVAALILARFPVGDHSAAAFLMIAELGLVVLLFAEASHTDLKLLSSSRSLPTRLLTGGMLLTCGIRGLVRATRTGFDSAWAGVLRTFYGCH